jgi:hypothetical protein
MPGYLRCIACRGDHGVMQVIGRALAGYYTCSIRDLGGTPGMHGAADHAGVSGTSLRSTLAADLGPVLVVADRCRDPTAALVCSRNGRS